ncbi:MAG: H-X9-DG-CTERM domain-containing protein, partial [Planctomycetota bacterium]
DSPRDLVSALGYGPDPTRPDTVGLVYNKRMQVPGGPIGRAWGPSSEHAGIVYHGFGDGHVESISLEVDWGVYAAGITIDGGEEISFEDF